MAPRTAWGVGRVIQQFGREGSTVGAHLTLVHRDLAATDALAAVQVRNAITTGVDTRIRFKAGNYEAAGNIGLTVLDGEPAAIERVQRSSGHYLQRLDQPTIRLDPTRRSLGGTQIQGSLNKIGGRHWLWGGSTMIESPEFEPTDFGRLNYAGDIMGGPRHLSGNASGPYFPCLLISGESCDYLVFRHRLGSPKLAQQQQQLHLEELLGGHAERDGTSADRTRS